MTRRLPPIPPHLRAAGLARIWRSGAGALLLDTLRRRLPWPADVAPSVLLADLDRVVEGWPGMRTAILTDKHSDALPGAIARWWRTDHPVLHLVTDPPPKSAGQGPEQAPQTLRVRAGSASAIHTALTAYGPFDVLVDATAASDGERLARLKRNFFHCKRGGRYLTRLRANGQDAVAEFVTRVAGIKVSGPVRRIPPLNEDKFLARAFAQVRSDHGVLQITNGVRAMPKLHYNELDKVLAQRSLPVAKTRLLRLAPLSWDSRCRLTENRPQERWAYPHTFRVPRLALRSYHDVLAVPHQVLVMDGILLPDSYRHSHEPVLNNAWTTDINAGFAVFKRARRKPVRLRGAYFYLGSEHPHHFGHVMTEQLTRLWAWDEAKRRFPHLKALVSVRGQREGLEPFEKTVFAAFGIAAEDLVAVKGPARVTTMLAANPMLVNNGYIHPDVAQVWRRTGAALLAAAPVREYPDKIFISRHTWRESRRCHNSAQVEEFFRTHGYTIVYPEDHHLTEQVMIFDQARAVAGYGGSGLLNLMFCREPKDVILVSSAAYNSHNEYLIASVLGHRLTMVWCEPDIAHPPGGWWRGAYASPYRLNFERDGKFLQHALASTD